MDSMARTRELLDEESRVRSGVRRERRMRIAEMTERLSGMHGAMRKANDILFDEQLQQLEADLRAELEDEIERLESEALEREERLLREEMLHRLRRRRTGSGSSWIWRETGGWRRTQPSSEADSGGKWRSRSNEERPF